VSQLACWAIPVRGGHVLRADADTGRAIAVAGRRSRTFWTWNIAVLAPAGASWPAERLRHLAAHAVDYAWRTSPAPALPARPAQWGWSRWMDLGLGLAFVAVSGGHWVLALAGAWLLAGRRWAHALLRIDPPDGPRTYAPLEPASVTLAPHASLTSLAALVDGHTDDAVAYAVAESWARAHGLYDAVAVYALLARGASLDQLMRDVGLWVRSDAAAPPAAGPVPVGPGSHPPGGA